MPQANLMEAFFILQLEVPSSQGCQLTTKINHHSHPKLYNLWFLQAIALGSSYALAYGGMTGKSRCPFQHSLQAQKHHRYSQRQPHQADVHAPQSTVTTQFLLETSYILGCGSVEELMSSGLVTFLNAVTNS